MPSPLTEQFKEYVETTEREIREASTLKNIEEAQYSIELHVKEINRALKDAKEPEDGLVQYSDDELKEIETAAQDALKRLGACEAKLRALQNQALDNAFDEDSEELQELAAMQIEEIPAEIKEVQKAPQKSAQEEIQQKTIQRHFNDTLKKISVIPTLASADINPQKGTFDKALAQAKIFETSPIIARYISTHERSELNKVSNNAIEYLKSLEIEPLIDEKAAQKEFNTIVINTWIDQLQSLEGPTKAEQAKKIVSSHTHSGVSTKMINQNIDAVKTALRTYEKDPSDKNLAEANAKIDSFSQSTIVKHTAHAEQTDLSESAKADAERMRKNIQTLNYISRDINSKSAPSISAADAMKRLESIQTELQTLQQTLPSEPEDMANRYLALNKLLVEATELKNSIPEKEASIGLKNIRDGASECIGNTNKNIHALVQKVRSLDYYQKASHSEFQEVAKRASSQEIDNIEFRNELVKSYLCYQSSHDDHSFMINPAHDQEFIKALAHLDTLPKPAVPEFPDDMPPPPSLDSTESLASATAETTINPEDSETEELQSRAESLKKFIATSVEKKKDFNTKDTGQVIEAYKLLTDAYREAKEILSETDANSSNPAIKNIRTTTGLTIKSIQTLMEELNASVKQQHGLDTQSTSVAYSTFLTNADAFLATKTFDSAKYNELEMSYLQYKANIPVDEMILSKHTQEVDALQRYNRAHPESKITTNLSADQIFIEAAKHRGNLQKQAQQTMETPPAPPSRSVSTVIPPAQPSAQDVITPATLEKHKQFLNELDKLKNTVGSSPQTPTLEDAAALTNLHLALQKLSRDTEDFRNTFPKSSSSYQATTKIMNDTQAQIYTLNKKIKEAPAFTPDIKVSFTDFLKIADATTATSGTSSAVFVAYLKYISIADENRAQREQLEREKSDGRSAQEVLSDALKKRPQAAELATPPAPPSRQTSVVMNQPTTPANNAAVTKRFTYRMLSSDGKKEYWKTFREGLKTNPSDADIVELHQATCKKLGLEETKFAATRVLDSIHAFAKEKSNGDLEATAYESAFFKAWDAWQELDAQNHGLKTYIDLYNYFQAPENKEKLLANKDKELAITFLQTLETIYKLADGIEKYTEEHPNATPDATANVFSNTLKDAKLSSQLSDFPTLCNTLFTKDEKAGNPYWEVTEGKSMQWVTKYPLCMNTLVANMASSDPNLAKNKIIAEKFAGITTKQNIYQTIIAMQLLKGGSGKSSVPTTDVNAAITQVKEALIAFQNTPPNDGTINATNKAIDDALLILAKKLNNRAKDPGAALSDKDLENSAAILNNIQNLFDLRLQKLNVELGQKPLPSELDLGQLKKDIAAIESKTKDDERTQANAVKKYAQDILKQIETPAEEIGPVIPKTVITDVRKYFSDSLNQILEAAAEEAAKKQIPDKDHHGINIVYLSKKQNPNLPVSTSGTIEVRYLTEGKDNNLIHTSDFERRIEYFCNVAEKMNPEKAAAIKTIKEKYIGEVRKSPCNVDAMDLRAKYNKKKFAPTHKKLKELYQAVQEELITEIKDPKESNKDAKEKFEQAGKDYIRDRGRPIFVNVVKGKDGQIKYVNMHTPKGEKTYASHDRRRTELGVNPNAFFDVYAVPHDDKYEVLSVTSRAVSYSNFERSDQYKNVWRNFKTVEADLSAVAAPIAANAKAGETIEVNFDSISLLSPYMTTLEKAAQAFKKTKGSVHDEEAPQVRDHARALAMNNGRTIQVKNANGEIVNVKFNIIHLNVATSINGVAKKTDFTYQEMLAAQEKINARSLPIFCDRQEKSLHGLLPVAAFKADSKLAKNWGDAQRDYKEACDNYTESLERYYSEPSSENAKACEECEKEVKNTRRSLTAIGKDMVAARKEYWEQNQDKWVQAVNQAKDSLKNNSLDPAEQDKLKQFVYYANTQQQFFTKDYHTAETAYLLANSTHRASELNGDIVAINCKSNNDRSGVKQQFLIAAHEYEKTGGVLLPNDKDSSDFLEKELGNICEYSSGLNAIDASRPGTWGNRCKKPDQFAAAKIGNKISGLSKVGAFPTGLKKKLKAEVKEFPDAISKRFSVKKESGKVVIPKASEAPLTKQMEEQKVASANDAKKEALKQKIQAQREAMQKQNEILQDAKNITDETKAQLSDSSVNQKTNIEKVVKTNDALNKKKAEILDIKELEDKSTPIKEIKKQQEEVIEKIPELKEQLSNKQTQTKSKPSSISFSSVNTDQKKSLIKEETLLVAQITAGQLVQFRKEHITMKEELLGKNPSIAIEKTGISCNIPAHYADEPGIKNAIVKQAVIEALVAYPNGTQFKISGDPELQKAAQELIDNPTEDVKNEVVKRRQAVPIKMQSGPGVPQAGENANLDEPVKQSNRFPTTGVKNQ